MYICKKKVERCQTITFFNSFFFLREPKISYLHVGCTHTHAQSETILYIYIFYLLFFTSLVSRELYSLLGVCFPTISCVCTRARSFLLLLS